MSNVISYNPNRAVDANGEPEAGAVATYFDTGTTNPQTVFTDKALTQGITSLTADSSGVFATVFSLDAVDLKVVVKTAGGAAISTADPAPVYSPGGAASSIPFSPIPNNLGENVQDAIANNSNRERVVPTILSSGSGTYTVPTGVRSIRVRMVGAGGGGGGADGVGGGNAAVAGGGGAGGFVEFFIASVAASYAYAVGALGAGGTAGDNDGTIGADTTFGALTASGGVPGTGRLGVSGSVSALGGVGGAATGGDINKQGGHGASGFMSGGVQMDRPDGGSGEFGTGGSGPTTSGAGAASQIGINGDGYGAGGSGAVVIANSNTRAGGDGTGGLIVIEEFY